MPGADVGVGGDLDVSVGVGVGVGTDVGVDGSGVFRVDVLVSPDGCLFSALFFMHPLLWL